MTNDIDLGGLSRSELKQLQKRIDRQLEKLEKADRKAALDAAEAAAREAGYSLGELMGGAPSSVKTKTPAKYRDPETGKTWSGRGRRPDWIKTAGDDLSKFEI